MAEEGAAVIDIGGESTRPGASPVTAEEEQARMLPVIAALAGSGEALISVDTYREETARLAVAAGAHIVNDVWGLQREPGIARVAAETGAGLVIMHTGRERQKLPDVIADQFFFLRTSLEIARRSGVPDDHIVLDAGFGFAKETAEENLDLMARFSELKALGFPLMAGTSRKRFIGTVTGREAADARRRHGGHQRHPQAEGRRSVSRPRCRNQRGRAGRRRCYAGARNEPADTKQCTSSA